MPDLVTQEEVQDYMGTVEDYGAAIARASRQVEVFIGHPVLASSVVEQLDGGTPYLILKAFPFTTVSVLDTVSKDVVSDYTAYPEEGILLSSTKQWGAGQRRYEVTYTPGLASSIETVPQDIKQAVYLYIAMDHEHGTDPAQTQETSGDYNHTFSQQEFMSKIHQLLDGYRDVVV